MTTIVPIAQLASFVDAHTFFRAISACIHCRARNRAPVLAGHIVDIYDGCLNVADYLCGRWRSAERRM